MPRRTFADIQNNPRVIHTEHGWNAQSHSLKALLGIKGKLPPEGMPPRVIQGIVVWVKPLDDSAPRSGCVGRHFRRMQHRVMARCPQCGKEMSAGRLHQHVC